MKKLPALSEKISVLLDVLPLGSKRVIVILAFAPVCPISKIDSPGSYCILVVLSEISPEPDSTPIENFIED